MNMNRLKRLEDSLRPQIDDDDDSEIPADATDIYIMGGFRQDGTRLKAGEPEPPQIHLTPEEYRAARKAGKFAGKCVTIIVRYEEGKKNEP